MTLTPKTDSPLADLPVTLTCTIKSGLDTENVVSAPAFDSEQTTYSWAVTGRTKSGTFQLSLAGKGMTTPITLAISKLVSTNLADEVEVSIGGESVPPGGNVFFRGQARDVELIPKLGSPIDGYPIALTRTAKSPLQQNDLSSAPPFDPFQTTHKWRVTGATRSGTFELHMTAQGMTTSIDVTANKLLSTNLADEVEVKIGEEGVPSAGNVFFRGQAMDVELIPKPGSPIAGHPIALTRTAKLPLQHNDLSSAPRFDPFQTTHKWRVTGANRSGIFELHMTAQGMTTPINVIDNKLLSTNLADEVEVKIGGESVPSFGNVFFRGQAKDVELIPKADSPIAGHPIALTCTTNIPLQLRDFSSEPPFNPFQTTHKWRVTGANRSGTFQLHLTADGMTTRIDVTANKLLSTNLADEVTPLLNGNEVSGLGNVFVGGVDQTLTLSYKNGGYLTGVPMSLNWVPKSGLVLSDVTSVPARNAVTTSHSWNVVGGLNKTGVFDLKLMAGGGQAEIVIPDNKLFPEAANFRFLDTKGDFHPIPPALVRVSLHAPFFAYVRLTAWEGSPLVNIPVTFHFPGYPAQTYNTNSGGDAMSSVVAYAEEGVREVYAEAALQQGGTITVKILLDLR